MKLQGFFLFAILVGVCFARKLEINLNTETNQLFGISLVGLPDTSGLPQTYTGGYVMNCLSSGIIGGCSSCVLGSKGACDWISITEKSLPPNSISETPFGGAGGVCAPKGLIRFKSWAVNFYLDSIFNGVAKRNLEEAEESTQSFEIPIIPVGTSVDPNDYILSVENDRCPSDPSKEKVFRGFGTVPNEAEIRSSKFEPGFCAFPTNPHIVDRSAFPVFGGQFRRFGLSAPELYCNAVNDADNDQSSGFFSPISGNKGNVRRNAAFSLRSYLENNAPNSRSSSRAPLSVVRTCAMLDQSAACTTFCPAYGAEQGVIICPENIETLQTGCQGIIESVIRPIRKRAFGDGLEGALTFFAASSFLSSPDVIKNYLAAYKTKGFEPKCVDIFSIPASDRWMTESHLKDPCKSLGRPYVDVCNGECTIVYNDPNNCGRCGRVCQSEFCSEGRCEEPDFK